MKVRDLPPNALGAVYMAFGSLVAVVNDGLVRLATEDGLDVYQALFLRVRPAVPDSAALATRRGEHVTRRQYVLVAIGFAGVVAVVRPTPGGFSPWVLLVIVAAAAVVVREFATQQVEARTPPLAIALLTAVAVTAMAGAISVVTGWETIGARAAVVLLLACVCLVVGYLFGIEAVRVGDLGVSSPFRYTTVVGAVAVGFAFFRETPDALTIVGCTLIVVAGVVTARLDVLPTKRALPVVTLR